MSRFDISTATIPWFLKDSQNFILNWGSITYLKQYSFKSNCFRKKQNQNAWKRIPLLLLLVIVYPLN
jgi:hypothetical protein